MFLLQQEVLKHLVNFLRKKDDIIKLGCLLNSSGKTNKDSRRFWEKGELKLDDDDDDDYGGGGDVFLIREKECIQVQENVSIFMLPILVWSPTQRGSFT